MTAVARLNKIIYTEPLRVASSTAMLPRSLKGHAWYQDKFMKEFPRDRKAVIPGIL